MLKSLIFIVVLGAAVVADDIPTKTECQLHREKELERTAIVPMRLIPECYVNGDYKPLQCFQDSKFCSCWSKLGRPITHPSTKLKSCDCPIQQNGAIKHHVVGNYVPQCEEDGSFTKRQCRGSTDYCWCVDTETGVQVGKAAMGLKCD